VAEVARLALEAERAIGAAADVEWAVADGRVWLLQARPMTALPPAPEKAKETQTRVDSSPGFPFIWPSADAAERHWVQRAVDGRAHEVMPPMELDVRARWARTFEHAAHVAGWSAEQPRILEVNGRQYWHYPPPVTGAPADAHREHVSKTFERWGEQLCERGENFLDAVTFPEMKEGDWKLAAVEPDALPPPELAAHLTAALNWLERGWTLHWARPKAIPAERFTRIYSKLAGEQGRPAMEAARMLLSYEPNKMTEAVDGLGQPLHARDGGLPRVRRPRYRERHRRSRKAPRRPTRHRRRRARLDPGGGLTPAKLLATWSRRRLPPLVRRPGWSGLVLRAAWGAPRAGAPYWLAPERSRRRDSTIP
jgi:hypothetical protein